MMSTKNWIFGALEAVLWYGFIYNALYAFKNPVDLYWSSLVLLVLAYAAAVACPIVRSSGAWRTAWRKEQ